MTELAPGILDARDPETHALQLGTFEPPSMPGSFNALIRDVSKRANVRVGTKAQRDAAQNAGDVWKGLCWITIPDDPAVAEWTARPVYWAGTYWDDPLARERARYFPRPGGDIGFNPGARRGVTGGNWQNAPAGDYAIDADFVMAGSKASSMTISSAANGVTLRVDYRDDIGTDRRAFHLTGVVSGHPGGDLNIDVSAFIADVTAPATLYANGTGVRMLYLGPKTK